MFIDDKITINNKIFLFYNYRIFGCSLSPLVMVPKTEEALPLFKFAISYEIGNYELFGYRNSCHIISCFIRYYKPCKIISDK